MAFFAPRHFSILEKRKKHAQLTGGVVLRGGSDGSEDSTRRTSRDCMNKSILKLAWLGEGDGGTGMMFLCLRGTSLALRFFLSRLDCLLLRSITASILSKWRRAADGPSCGSDLMGVTGSGTLETLEVERVRENERPPGADILSA
jgi:hypothetical protein